MVHVRLAEAPSSKVELAVGVRQEVGHIYTRL